MLILELRLCERRWCYSLCLDSIKLLLHLHPIARRLLLLHLHLQLIYGRDRPI